MRSLYSHAHRKMILHLLDLFDFRINQSELKDLLNAIEFIKKQKDIGSKFYPDTNVVPIKGVIANEWLPMVVDENNQIDCMNYEVAVLEELRRHLRCKSIWIEGAYRYRNPDDDTPKDFNDRRNYYYEMLNLPLNPDDAILDVGKILLLKLKSLSAQLATKMPQ